MSDLTTPDLAIRYANPADPVGTGALAMANLANDVEDELINAQLRVAELISTADSGAIGTTEAVVRTLTTPTLKAGFTYRVKFVGACQTGTNGNHGLLQIRETNLAGAIRQLKQIHVAAASAAVPAQLEYQWDQVTAAARTWVLTMDLVIGTGSVNLDAGADHPDYFYVDRIRKT